MRTSNENTGGTLIKDRFKKLDMLRNSHLTRARKCSEVSIPSLIPPENYNENDPLPTPYQSMGARCVNNVSSKLLLTMLPPNSPFFKYGVPSNIMDAYVEENGEEDFKTNIEKKLRNIEQDIMDYIESEGHRSTFYKLLRLLIVSGNVLLEMSKDEPVKTHRLDKYVTRRSPAGKPIEIILREHIDKTEVPEGIDTTKVIAGSTDGTKTDKKLIELYTHSKKMKDGKWKVTQECCGQPVPNTSGTFKDEDHPFLAISLNQIEGEDYGRGLVEEYLGDFISLEALNQAVVEGAAAAARILFLVKPGSSTNWKDVRDARNLSAIAGRRDDIETLQIDKLSDFQIAYDMINKLEDRLSRTFLLSDSVQRQAERVTAQEIQYMARQLEQSMGGIYTTLSQDVQRPYLMKVVNRMKQNKLLSFNIPEGMKLTITTGFEALGRGHELTKLDALMDRLQKLLPNEMLLTTLGRQKVKVLIDKYATAVGIDTDGWIPTKEEIIQQEEEQKKAAQAQQIMDNPAAQDIIKDQVKQGGLQQ